MARTHACFHSETLVFKESDSLPSTKAVTLTSNRTGLFEVSAHYGNPAQLPKGTPAHIGTCRGRGARIRARIRTRIRTRIRAGIRAQGGAG